MPGATAANISMTPLSPAVLTADGASHATATVTLTDAGGAPVPSDPPQMSAPADPGVGFSVTDNHDGTYTVTVTSSTAAHQVTVTATADGISASEPLTLVHGPARVVNLHLAKTQLTANGIATTTAFMSVSDRYGNPISGDALALGSSDPGVRFGHVTDWGNGTYTAPVTSSNTPGAVALQATDVSSPFIPSDTASLTEVPAPSLLGTATMQWTFYYTRAFTVVRLLTIFGAPASASVSVACTGHGCPFSTWTVKAGTLPRCTSHSHGACRSGGGVLLAPRLGRRHLAAGARLTVRITRTGWIGKFYGFHMRSATGPAINVTCLAPGGTQPGAGCT